MVKCPHRDIVFSARLFPLNVLRPQLLFTPFNFHNSLKLSLMCQRKNPFSWFRSKNKVCVWTLREGRSACFHLLEVPSFGRWRNTFGIGSRRAVSRLRCRRRQQLSRPVLNGAAPPPVTDAARRRFGFCVAVFFSSVCIWLRLSGWRFWGLWSFSVSVE